MGYRKEISLRRKLLLPVMIVVILQATLFLGIIFKGQMFGQIKTSAYSNVQESVERNAEELQNMLLWEWSDLEYYEVTMQRAIQKCVEQAGETIQDLKADGELCEQVLRNTEEDLSIMLRSTGASGVFLVFDGTYEELNENQRYGLCLYDEVPGKTPEDSSDITVKCGNGSFFDVTRQRSTQFFNSTIENGNLYTQMTAMEIGQWNGPYDMFGENCFTFTIPLLDENHQAYGVMGVMISTDYLKSKMKYKELTEDGSGAYFLVHKNLSGEDYTAVLSNMSAEQEEKALNSIMSFDYEKGYKKGLYPVNGAFDESCYAAIKQISLYKNTSLHSATGWMLVGVVSEHALLWEMKKLIFLLVGAFLGSLAIGVLGTIGCSFVLVRPLDKLTANLRNSEAGKNIFLERTNIREIDELSASFMEMSQRLENSDSKIINIMQMVDFPFGVIEYDRNGESIFCTEDTFRILEISSEEWKDQYIPRLALEKECIKMLKRIQETEDEEHTYQMNSIYQKEKWIRFKKKRVEDKILIIILDVTKEMQDKRRIEYERDYDGLTRLLNRNAFCSQVGRILENGHIGTAAMVMWDLDGLKYFNDTYGHDCGDQYIREAASILALFAQYQAVIARRSGDEFFVFIYGFQDKQEIRDIIYDIHDKLKNHKMLVPTGEEVRIRASAGIAWYPDDATGYGDLVKYADFAMYDIKRSVKGHIKEFDKEAYLKDSLLFSGREELNKLIEHTLVRYAFQPIVDAKSGNVFAFEALMRPQIESLKSPEDVIRLARSQSKLYQLERLTWFKTLADFALQKDKEKYHLFINSIPNHMLNQNDWKRLEELHGNMLHQIVVEIIESEQSDRNCMQTKKEWAEKQGASIALDDYGAGYSNDSTLLYINPRFVKIDMSIIRDIDKDEGKQLIVSNLVQYAKGHNIKIVAEGIETEAIMQTVMDCGVDYMQGYFFGKGEFEIQEIPKEKKELIRTYASKISKRK